MADRVETQLAIGAIRAFREIFNWSDEKILGTIGKLGIEQDNEFLAITKRFGPCPFDVAILRAEVLRLLKH